MFLLATSNPPDLEYFGYKGTNKPHSVSGCLEDFNISELSKFWPTCSLKKREKKCDYLSGFHLVTAREINKMRSV